ncbi:hypothetical protein PAAG_01803 [Paracoccidioides lutzii Pb01]|uniref:C6 transcription factor n=1 Tax=Paracoccidioides lutzii (strain ATCC MYA-826 / Pb01) TaxID=502779 RepID=C1GTF8_PARBA|nr:hypothetical protein PAAG_01803 [Paracoccidioides lutzii Pb01]EEH39614.2 hypothetical protein PAAG_01803 [Paracoccidioides lutzii Pb01]
MVSTRQHPTDFSSKSISSPTQAAGKKHDITTANTRQWRHTPSKIVTPWLCLSIPFVLWDASYVLCRPHSMPGGKLHYLWTPYGLYGKIDYIYGWPAWSNGNGFTSAQVIMNLVESSCYLFYLHVLFQYGTTLDQNEGRKGGTTRKSGPLDPKKYIVGRLGAIAVLVVFSASVMTVSKTVLYALNEACSGFDNVRHNGFWTLILLYIIPNGLWIVVPGYASYYFGKEIINAIESPSALSDVSGDLKLK